MGKGWKKKNNGLRENEELRKIMNWENNRDKELGKVVNEEKMGRKRWKK